MARARGEKVMDDPTRLRRSLKKDAKAAAKRAGAWAERTQAQKKSQSERQTKCVLRLLRRGDALRPAVHHDTKRSRDTREVAA